MLLTKLELEEMVGYSLEQLGVNLTTDRTYKDLYEVDRDDLTELFQRVLELAYTSGQNNILENTGY